MFFFIWESWVLVTHSVEEYNHVMVEPENNQREIISVRDFWFFSIVIIYIILIGSTGQR